MFSKILYAHNDGTPSIVNPTEGDGPRFVPAFDLINVVEKIEEVLSFMPPNGTSEQESSRLEDNNILLQNANKKGRPFFENTIFRMQVLPHNLTNVGSTVIPRYL